MGGSPLYSTKLQLLTGAMFAPPTSLGQLCPHRRVPALTPLAYCGRSPYLPLCMDDLLLAISSDARYALLLASSAFRASGVAALTGLWKVVLAKSLLFVNPALHHGSILAVSKLGSDWRGTMSTHACCPRYA